MHFVPPLPVFIFVGVAKEVEEGFLVVGISAVGCQCEIAVHLLDYLAGDLRQEFFACWGCCQEVVKSFMYRVICWSWATIAVL